jgi:hypothetical protein
VHGTCEAEAIVHGTCEAEAIVHGTCEAEAIVHGTCEAEAIVHGTCEAGGSIKPGAQAPGKQTKIEARARETGDSVYWFRAVARFTGSTRYLSIVPGACAPGFILPPASQVRRTIAVGVTLPRRLRAQWPGSQTKNSQQQKGSGCGSRV